MPLKSGRQSPRRWKTAVSVAVILVVVLVAYGVVIDLSSGLPLSLTSRSWVTWLLGIIAFAVLYLVAEGAGEWIWRHKTGHSLSRRVWRLTLLIGLVVVLGLVTEVIIRAAQ